MDGWRFWRPPGPPFFRIPAVAEDLTSDESTGIAGETVSEETRCLSELGQNQHDSIEISLSVARNVNSTRYSFGVSSFRGMAKVFFSHTMDRLAFPRVKDAFNSICRLSGGSTMKSSFSTSLVLRNNGDFLTRLAEWCFWHIAGVYGETHPRLLGGDNPPLPNRMTSITADLSEQEYVEDSGFTLYDAALVGGSVAPPLDAERAPPGTETDYMWGPR